MPGDALKDLADTIKEKLGAAFQRYEFFKDELVISVEPQDIVKVLDFLRDDKECDFQLLMDVCGADYPSRPKRFDVIYTLLSLRHNHRVRVKIQADEDTLVPSVVGVYSSAGWFEREVWDMYGVMFAGNPDLRRILTDYGFEGHPQRKDFPLTGYVELRYDDALKRVVYEPVQLNQDFRSFDFLSPWEGITDVQLPGDEKSVKPAHGYREESQRNRNLESQKRKFS
jgi:NADH-quinone oxidoreductase subunit C